MRAIERILKLIKDKGLSKSSVEKSVGLSNGYLQNMANQNGKLGAEKLLEIAKHLEVTSEYLITGIEYNLTKKKNNYSKEPNELENYGKGRRGNLTIVPLKAYGGFLNGYKNRIFIDSLEHASFPFIQGECYSFEVDGYSMVTNDDSSIKPGDYVIGTELPDVSWITKGKIYIFVTIDGIITKIFNKIQDDKYYLKSANDEYNPVPPIPVKSVKKIYFKEFVIKK